jgi:hypothetical protein
MTCAVLLVLVALSLLGQVTPQPIITVTPQDIEPGSLRLISGLPDDIAHNLVFRYRLKTPEEIGAIRNSQPLVQISSNGVVVIKNASCGGYQDKTGKLIGLVLLFHTYEELKLAEKTLRSDK